ncbi:FYVE/PHD zinc finger protein [Coniochaeta sp. PMI_546]|nr:FYVE/PHD zinc finger protein [Coniochaeta sp. PMI_546]
MATELIMPRLQDQQQSSFFPAQNQQQSQPPQWQQQQVLPTFAPPPQQQGQSSTKISPLSTSGSASPTSPKAYHTRQIRPLYMPAVLRPTEHHSKAPPTRTKVDNSDDEDDRTLRSNSSFITLSGALGRISRRSTGDSGKCVDGNWNLEAFAKPTGMPTREHWKPDHESTVCDHSTCRRTFNYFTRRHHCRRCGNIFCDFHSAYEVPLDEGANYNPRGVPVRACAHCYSQFKEWRSRANMQ